MYAPYKDQQEEIDKIVNFVKKGNKKECPIYVYPTSFGKSIVIANVAIKLDDYYFINIAPSKELVEQNYNKYISYGYEASICSQSLGRREVGKVTFATVGTLKSYVDFYKDKKVVFFIDECHEATKKGSVLHKIIKKIKNHTLIGTTATPINRENTMNGSMLVMMDRSSKSLFNKIASVIQIQTLTKNKRWTPLEYIDRGYDLSGLELNTSNTDFTEESVVRNYFEKGIGDKIEQEIELLRKQGVKSILVFLTSIQEIEDMSSRVKGSTFVHSKITTKDRAKNIGDFVNGKIDVMFQCDILTTGFDFPALESIIFSRPTHSLTIWYQGIGRLVRTFKGKSKGIVVDLSGNYEKFGRIEDITFEDNEYTNGYACFSADTLITGYYLGYIFPKRDEVKSNFEKKMKNQEDSLNGIMTFGKYKGKTVKDVSEKDRGYLLWLMKNKDFKWYGEAMNNLKTEIDRVLRTHNLL